MTKSKTRLLYALSFIALFIIETLIALYVHDAIIRPYVGDIIVVILLYTLIKIFYVKQNPLLPLYITVFAVFVEVLQKFDYATLLGVQNNPFLRTILGSHFDIYDIVCYIIGGLLLAVYEFILRRQRH